MCLVIAQKANADLRASSLTHGSFIVSIQKKEMITDEHLEVRPNNQQDSAEQFDLFNILWGAKIKIISITAIFIVAAVLYAVTAQKWWSTQAIVIPAQLNDYSEYRNQVKQYQAIFDVYQQDGTVLINKELNQLIKSENIFEHFINTFNSLDNRKSFLSKNEQFKNYIENNQITDESEKIIALSKWLDKISAIQASKEEDNIYRLTVQSTTKTGSYTLFSQYVDYVSILVFKDSFANLTTMTNAKKNELEQKLAIFEQQARNYLNVETQRTQMALEIAQAAQLSAPVENLTDKDFSIQLGAKALSAKAKILSKVNDLGIIDPSIQQIRAKLRLLNDIKINKDIKFNSFRYLNNPTIPLSKDKPKGVLIIMLGIVLGLISSCAIVLAQANISHRKVNN